jgi:hypothetical protein
LKGCRISFDAPAASTPWKITADSASGEACEAQLEAEVPGHPPLLGSEKNPMHITLKVESFPQESCATAHAKATANTSGLFGNRDLGTLEFIPEGWFPRARGLPQMPAACLDLASSRFTAIIGFKFIAEMKPADYPIVRAMVANAGRAVLARGAASRMPSPAPAPASAAAPAPAPMTPPSQKAVEARAVAPARSPAPMVTQWDIQIANFREGVRLRPESYVAHYLLASMLAESGQHAEAIVHLRKAIELEPKSPLFHIFLSESLAATGQKEEALREADRAVALGPDNSDIRMRRDRVIAKLK